MRINVHSIPCGNPLILASFEETFFLIDLLQHFYENEMSVCVCVCVYFLKMIYIPLIYILILLYYLNNCSFVVSFKISKCKPFTHHLKKWFAIIGHFHFHINVKTSFSVSKYKLPNVFIYWGVSFPKRIPTLSCSIYNILHLYFITVTFVLLFC